MTKRLIGNSNQNFAVTSTSSANFKVAAPTGVISRLLWCAIAK
ncbi:hypothetical protein [Pseudanabaena sp. PCC 6802]|nr:hypothetical protein [Pseudanabaena sp. PCC 6802]